MVSDCIVCASLAFLGVYSFLSFVPPFSLQLDDDDDDDNDHILFYFNY